MKYVDMHCDTITGLYRNKGSLRENDMHIDLGKMKKGECLLQNFAIFTYLPKQDASFTRAAIDYYYEQMDANKDLIAPAYCYDDIIKNETNGLMNGLLTLEEGAVLELRQWNRLPELHSGGRNGKAGDASDHQPEGRTDGFWHPVCQKDGGAWHDRRCFPSFRCRLPFPYPVSSAKKRPGPAHWPPLPQYPLLPGVAARPSSPEQKRGPLQEYCRF